MKKKQELFVAHELKKLLTKGSSGYTQRDMARALDIDERTMRRYVSGDVKIPRVVQVAIACFVDHDDTHRDEACGLE